MSNSDTWDVEFTPSYTPLEMLEMGVFEGKYINNIKGLPASWKSVKKVLGPKDEPNPEINYYGIKARMPLSHWKEKGWIKTDKNGWFEWYCHYYLGRRLGEEDKWQINRWKSFVARHQGQIKASCDLSNKKCHTKQRQAVLQFGWDSSTAFTEEQKIKNLKKFTSNKRVSLESFTTITPPWLRW